MIRRGWDLENSKILQPLPWWPLSLWGMVLPNRARCYREGWSRILDVPTMAETAGALRITQASKGNVVNHWGITFE